MSESYLHRLLNQSPVPLSKSGPNLRVAHRVSRDEKQQMEAIGAVGTLFSIVSRIDTSVARAEWKLYRTVTGEDAERPEVTSHAALSVWNRPNPQTTGFEFREASQQYMELTGEMPWVIGRNKRSPIPLELWPVRPDRISPVPDPHKGIQGYLYVGPNEEKIPLDLEDVIYTKTPNPLDPYRGMGPVQSILADLESSKFAAEWNRNFFINSAEPGGIIEVPGKMDESEWDLFRKRWRTQHQGVAASHRVGLLEGGAKWVDRKYSMRDMQFTELRKLTSDMILEAFGVHKHIVGRTEDVNRANAEAASEFFAEWLVIPRLERMRDTLNFRYLPLFGGPAAGLEFDFVDPKPVNAEEIRADRSSRVADALAMIAAGFEPVPVLEFFDLPEDLPYERPAVSLSTAPPADRGVADALLPAPRPRNARTDEDLPAELGYMQDDWDEALARVLAEWDGVLVTQRADLLGQIEAVVDADDPELMARVLATPDKGAEILADAMVAAAVRASQRLVDEAERQGVLIEPGVPPASDLRRSSIMMRASIREELVKRAAAAAELLSDSLSWSARREALRVWVPSMSGSEVVQKVRAFLESLVGRTERDVIGGALTAAQNAGRISTLKQAPVASYYASEQLDDNTCSPCTAIDGRRFASLESAEMQYGNGGYVDCAGRERCRGTIVAVWDTEG